MPYRNSIVVREPEPEHSFFKRMGAKFLCFIGKHKYIVSHSSIKAAHFVEVVFQCEHCGHFIKGREIYDKYYRVPGKAHKVLKFDEIWMRTVGPDWKKSAYADKALRKRKWPESWPPPPAAPPPPKSILEKAVEKTADVVSRTIVEADVENIPGFKVEHVEHFMNLFKEYEQAKPANTRGIPLPKPGKTEK